MLSVNTNISSIFAKRSLSSITQKIDHAFTKLGSGKRVNSAADDAAGLSISTRLEAQSRGMEKAVYSNNQSISMVQTAESALSEQVGLLQRMRELTVQSMNATNQDSDRASLQQEVTELKEEMNNIADLKFNNNDLFNREVILHTDGENGPLSAVSKLFTSKKGNRLARQSIHSSLTGTSKQALSTGDIVLKNHEGESFTVRGTDASDDRVSTSLNASSAIAKAKVINLHSDETHLEAIVQETDFVGGVPISATTLDQSNYLSINGEKISGFAVKEHDVSGSLVDAINAVSSDTGVIASLTHESKLRLIAEDGRNIQFEAVGNASNLGVGSDVISAGLTLRSTEGVSWTYATNEIDEKLGFIFNSTIPLSPGTASEVNSIGPSWQFISQNAGANFVSPEWSGHENNNIILTGVYNGFHAAGNHRFHIEVDEVNGGVYLAKLGPEDANGESEADYSLGSITFDPSGSGTYFFASAGTAVPAGVVGSQLSLPGAPGENIFKFTFQNANTVDSSDADGDGVDAFAFVAPVGDLAVLDHEVGLGYDRTVDGIDISTVSAAKNALFTIDLALGELSEARSEYGAMINFLEADISVLETAKVNTLTSQSRIVDADFAHQALELSSAQIIQQSAIAMLAQANLAPSQALQLLA